MNPSSTTEGSPPPARAAILLFAVFLAWPVVLVDNSGPSMADSVLLAAIRLVDHGTWTLARGQDPKVAFQTLAHDISVSGDRIYSGVGPGGSVVAAPFYFVLRPLVGLAGEEIITSRRILNYYLPNARGLGVAPPDHFPRLYLLQILLTWLVVAPLFAGLLVRLHRRLREWEVPPGQALLASLATGFGSMAVYYGSMFSRQALAYFLLWHALLTLASRRAVPGTAALAAGACAGLAVAVDYPALVLAALGLPLLLARMDRRGRLLVAVPLLAVLALTAAYHASAFGSFLSTPYHHRFWHTAEPLASRGIDLALFQEGPTAGLGVPDLSVMARLCFGAYKGIFIYSPVLLMGLAGHLAAIARGPLRRLHLASLGIFLAYLAFNSSLGSSMEDYGHHFWGGLAILWGPRYLFGIIPVLAVGLVRLDWERAWVRALAWLSLGLSVVFNLTGAAFSHVILSTPAFGDKLRRPLAHALGLLLEHGPRIPLLDVYGAPPMAQAAILLLLVGLSAGVFRVVLGRRG
jgi:hypothetical protein